MIVISIQLKMIVISIQYITTPSRCIRKFEIKRDTVGAETIGAESVPEMQKLPPAEKMDPKSEEINIGLRMRISEENYLHRLVYLYCDDFGMGKKQINSTHNHVHQIRKKQGSKKFKKKPKKRNWAPSKSIQ
jgi:hypothetical protein